MTDLMIGVLIALTTVTAGLLALAVVLDIAGERPYRQAVTRWRAQDRTGELCRLLTAGTAAAATWEQVRRPPRRGRAYRSEHARPEPARPGRHARSPQ